MKDNGYKNLWVMSGIVLALMLALSFWGWNQIPAGAEVPVHFDINGNPDRYGSPFWAMFSIPIVTLFVVLLIAFIPVLEPRKENLKLSGRAYKVTWGALLLFMGGLHATLLLATLQIGRPDLINVFLPLGMGGLFIVLGNMMGKVRSNFMFGIRTPWTLSSELSWNKTHRLGGRMMMGVGFLTVLTALFLPMSWVIGLMTAGLFLMLIVTLVYSWMIYKDDPEVLQA